MLATQNPIEYEGTFPLPEAQLDRFLMRVNLGYPDRVERSCRCWRAQQRERPIDDIQQVVTLEEVFAAQEAVKDVYVTRWCRTTSWTSAARRVSTTTCTWAPVRAAAWACFAPDKRWPPWPGATTWFRTT